MYSLSIIIPVYNEEKILEQNIKKLYDFCKSNLKANFTIVIADNRSIDKTQEIGKKLEKEFNNIKYLHLNKKGKGYAIKNAAIEFKSDWYFFTDIDLPTPLKYIKNLENAIFSEKYDAIFGCRHCKGGRIYGSWTRKFVSLCYLNVARLILLNFKIKDLQAGFKAWNSTFNQKIMSLCKDQKWLLDTEIVFYAHKKKFKIRYLPIEYSLEGRGRESRINIIKDSIYFLKKLISLRLRNIFK